MVEALKKQMEQAVLDKQIALSGMQQEYKDALEQRLSELRASHQSELQDKQAELQDLNDYIEIKNQDFQQIEEEIDQYQHHLQEKDQHIELLASENMSLKQMIQQQSTEKDKQVERDRDRFKELSEMLEKRIKEMTKEKEIRDGEMITIKKENEEVRKMLTEL